MINAAAPLPAAGTTEQGENEEGRARRGGCGGLSVRKSVKKRATLSGSSFFVLPSYRSPIERFRGGMGWRGADCEFSRLHFLLYS